MKKLSVLVVLALAASASAAVIENFEGYDVGDSFAGGTIVADPTDPDNKVLHLPGSAWASWTPPAGEGIVTIDVYDMGATAWDEGEPTVDHTYGPRWGVAGPVGNAGIALAARTAVNHRNGYGWGAAGPTERWWTVGYYGGPRLVESLQVIGEGTWDDPDVPGVGRWTTWTFYVAANGEVRVDNGTRGAYLLPDGQWGQNMWVPEGMDQIWVSGGRTANSNGLQGTALFDNITYVIPEPATLGLLAVGALAMLRRRRA